MKKKNDIQLTNPKVYSVKMKLMGLDMTVEIENPNGLNDQEITVNVSHKHLDKISDEKLNRICYYLDQEGFLAEARLHNLYF
jgi:hypothetical protein